MAKQISGEMRALMRSLSDDGLSNRAIAKQLGVSSGSVNNILSQGFKTIDHGQRLPGDREPQSSELTRTTIEAIRHEILTPQQEEMLKAHFEGSIKMAERFQAMEKRCLAVDRAITALEKFTPDDWEEVIQSPIKLRDSEGDEYEVEPTPWQVETRRIMAINSLLKVRKMSGEIEALAVKTAAAIVDQQRKAVGVDYGQNLAVALQTVQAAGFIVQR